jgi:BCCT, betaine/carnitine/choline family transporter
MQSSGPWVRKGYLVERSASGSRIDPTVFYVSLMVVLAFVAWGVLFTDNIAAVTGAVLSYVMTNFGWVFILSTLSFLVFMLYLAFSCYGSIRLGGDDEEPEFRTVLCSDGYALLQGPPAPQGVERRHVGHPKDQVDRGYLIEKP